MRPTLRRFTAWPLSSSALLTVVTLLAVSWATDVAAQADASGGPEQTKGLETIYSTARQRDEQIQDIPVSGTTLSRLDIERYDLQDMQDLSQIAPQLVVATATFGSGARMFLRGIGSPGGAGFEQAVGVVIDGVFYSRGRYLYQGYLDLEQVEVLKGPQALYFGKNTPAGLIVMKTGDPGSEFEAYARVGWEFEASEFRSEAVVSGPISDTFGLRLAVRYTDIDGWMENLAEGRPGGDPLGFDLPDPRYSKYPNNDEFDGRLTLRWEPTDTFDATLKVSGSHVRGAGPLGTVQLLECQGPGNTPLPIAGVGDPFDDCILNFKNSRGEAPSEIFVPEPPEYGEGPSYTEYDAITVTLGMNKHFGDLTITSITGYQHFKANTLDYSGMGASGQVFTLQQEFYDAFSQELRLYSEFDYPLNFLVGAFYQSTDMFFSDSSKFVPFPLDTATGRYFNYDKHSNTRGETWSLFGELIWDITEQLELSGGVRYTEEEKDSDMFHSYLHEFFEGALRAAGDPLLHKFSDSNVSPQVTLTYHVTDQVMVYGAYKTGYKSGGFNNTAFLLASLTVPEAAFDSEDVEGFEIGTKAEFLDNQLRVSLVAYLYNYKDLQVQTFNSDTTTFSTLNAAESRIQGFEFDFTWLVSQHFQLRGAVAFNRARYRDFLAPCFAGQTFEEGCNQQPNDAGFGVTQDVAGLATPLAPLWDIMLGFTYDVPLGNSAMLTVTMDGNYVSDYVTDVEHRPNGGQSDFVTLDASIRVNFSERWEFGVIGRNLTNQKILTLLSDRPLTGGTPGLPAGTPGAGLRSDYFAQIRRGREIMLQLQFRY